jgi:hypothetical protein
MHGGTNPGAPTGKAHGNYRSGVWTKEWVELRREASVLRRQARQIESLKSVASFETD